MAFTNLSGPVRVGTVTEGPSKNTGLVVLAQQYDSGTITGTAGTFIRATPFRVPRGAYIVDFIVDALEFPSGASEVTISIGTTLGGTDFINSASLTINGFYTAATAAGGAYENSISTLTTLTDPAVVASPKRTAALNGDALIHTTIQIISLPITQGRINITMLYVQRADNGSANPVNS
jgi:hypothetical protein